MFLFIYIYIYIYIYESLRTTGVHVPLPHGRQLRPAESADHLQGADVPRSRRLAQGSGASGAKVPLLAPRPPPQVPARIQEIVPIRLLFARQRAQLVV